LKQDAAVKRYLALKQPIRLANILDSIFEQFERYALVSKIKLTPVSPLPTGNEKLLDKNPTEATEKKLDKFLGSTKSPALARYLALSEQSAAATKAAIAKDKVPPGGPLAFFRGVETDLAEICIGLK
jgi:hypothetical protein